ncbi:MAG TPA: NUDIX domain-containing protein [Candidatus Thermoplasmatota archaeon]|nr:NUDIX domain-containing protein [Candidatus Thermoplasmatota archaeon]
MPLTVTPQAIAQAPAKFAHENGVQLRLQCFVTIRDAQDRVGLVRVEGIEGWCIPGETMLVNESPDQAAVRVARTWFRTPLGLQLERILSFPATGGDDDRWYLLFVYHADAPAALEGTPDTQEVRFFGLDETPSPFAMAHADVWGALRG